MNQLKIKNKYGKIVAIVDMDEKLTIEIPNCSHTEIDGRPNRPSIIVHATIYENNNVKTIEVINHQYPIGRS